MRSDYLSNPTLTFYENKIKERLGAEDGITITKEHIEKIRKCLTTELEEYKDKASRTTEIPIPFSLGIPMPKLDFDTLYDKIKRKLGV